MTYQRQGDCIICTGDVGYEGIAFAHVKMCLACSLRVVEEVRLVYNAPEITVIERIRHRNEVGPDGRRAKPLPRDPAYVYYVQVDDLIKIGFAKDVKKRMRAYPPNAKLLAVHPGTKDVERQMHVRFEADLARGREWFHKSPLLEDHISDTREQFGDPASHAYEYRKPMTEEERVRAQIEPRHAVQSHVSGTIQVY